MERVNHPNHYNKGKIEVIDFIEDQELNFCLGNVVKYVCRLGLKDEDQQELQKALWYLMRELSRYDENWKCMFQFVMQEMGGKEPNE